ncbi:hypothetical protein [Vibrio sp. SCSIO 43136]|uniref:hypothetical protein n=1 Tax=Vibrio sp. SCSIO 43136 TaxID=2819101 RepID=UPI00207608E3|nr:hypothetical protein [Vibrio sp. SCSIO 43136]USD67898.1 hypothetical protein J4N39_17080 [Vibrio sp. SCSIO 43136]
MSIKDTEIKLTIAKLIEISYSKNNGLTSAILLEVGSASLTVDDQGNAILSGKVGIVTFNGKDAIDEIGVQVKRLSVKFSNEGQGVTSYKATMSFVGMGLSVTGSFNVEELILSCSGLLCIAARKLKNRPKYIEDQLSKAIGN